MGSVVNSTPRLFHLRQTRYSLYTRLAGPQGFDPRTVQPVASRYTDYTIPARMYNNDGI
jgi:hypothetical protein